MVSFVFFCYWLVFNWNLEVNFYFCYKFREVDFFFILSVMFWWYLRLWLFGVYFLKKVNNKNSDLFVRNKFKKKKRIIGLVISLSK